MFGRGHKIFFGSLPDIPTRQRQQSCFKLTANFIGQRNNLAIKCFSGGRPRRIRLINFGAYLQNSLLNILVGIIAAAGKPGGILINLQGGNNVGIPVRGETKQSIFRAVKGKAAIGPSLFPNFKNSNDRNRFVP